MASLNGVEKHLHGNVVSSTNPLTKIVPRNRQQFQTSVDNDGNVRCSSPFTFARILFNGDVQLCYQFSVGNLHTESFEQIWNGKKSHAVRDMLKKTIATVGSATTSSIVFSLIELIMTELKITFLLH